MRRVVKKRQDKMRSFFDSVAGRLGKDYVPGQSWKGVAEALLRLMPPMVIADLGAGEGAFALLLAQRAKKVIAVDTSAKMIEVAREQALRHGVKNVEYRLGDMEEVPIARRSRRSGLLLPIASSRTAPRARRQRSSPYPQGRRPHRHPRSGEAPFRRGPRALRRRMARLQRIGSGIHAREGWLHACADLSRPQGARNPPVPNPPRRRRQEELAPLTKVGIRADSPTC